MNKNKSYIDPCLILYKYVAICPILILKTSFEPRHMAPGTIWQRLGHTLSRGIRAIVARSTCHGTQHIASISWASISWHQTGGNQHLQNPPYPGWKWKLHDEPKVPRPIFFCLRWKMEKGSKGSAVVVKSQSGQNTKIKQGFLCPISILRFFFWYFI